MLGIGQVNLSLVASSLGNEAVRDVGQFSIQVGGTVGTALSAIGALGGKPRLFGRLADDEFGRMAIDNLQRFGVDTANVLLQPNQVSPLTFINLDEDSHRRTMYVSRGNVDPLDPEDLSGRLFDGVGLLYLDGDPIPVQVAAAERARALGIPVLLDASRLGSGMGELLGMADVVIASERFATDVRPAGEIQDSLIELTRMGPKIAVVTLGIEGATALENEKLVHQNALDVPIVDRTGAGEVFRGAFAYAMMRGWPLERCMPFANAAGALACTALGPQGGITNLHAVLKAAGL